MELFIQAKFFLVLPKQTDIVKITCGCLVETDDIYIYIYKGEILTLYPPPLNHGEINFTFTPIFSCCVFFFSICLHSWCVGLAHTITHTHRVLCEWDTERERESVCSEGVQRPYCLSAGLTVTERYTLKQFLSLYTTGISEERERGRKHGRGGERRVPPTLGIYILGKTGRNIDFAPL